MATVAPRDPAQLPAAMRLAAALARFQTQLQADGRSPHTVAQYARHVRRFGAWLEAEHMPNDVADVEPEQLARFLASAEALRPCHPRGSQIGLRPVVPLDRRA
jgi:site-specific recombinase XerD